jgi:hypothetical protein
MDAIPQAFNPPCEPVDEVVPTLFVKVVGSQFLIGFMAGEHMEGAHDNGMRHGHDGALLASAGCQALIQGRQVGPLGAGGGMGQLRQPGPQDAIPLARLPRAPLPRQPRDAQLVALASRLGPAPSDSL